MCKEQCGLILEVDPQVFLGENTNLKIPQKNLQVFCDLPCLGLALTSSHQSIVFPGIENGKLYLELLDQLRSSQNLAFSKIKRNKRNNHK